MSRRRSKGKAAPLPLAKGWVALFVIAAIVSFSSAIRSPFEYDDIPAIERNESIRDLGSPGQLLTPPPQSPTAGRPVVNISLAVNYAINAALGIDQRPDPLGPYKTVSYHLVNLMVHVLCGLLLFGIVRRTLRLREDLVGDADAIAGGAVLLWLLHPIQTEAVHYLIQRTELLVSVCYAATIYASIRAWEAGEDGPRRRWFAVGVVACALGMLSKEVMITAPLMVVLYDRAFRASSWRALREDSSRVRFYLGLGATMFIVVWSVLAGARDQSVGFALGVSSYQYFLTQAWAVARYVRLIVWPTGLTFDYGYLPVTDARVIPGLVVLSAALAASIWAWTKPRRVWLGFFGAWFFLILAPSSSIVPIATEIAAERRVYLASVPLFILVALGIATIAARLGKGRNFSHACIAALALILGGATFVRGLTYTSSERLYRDTIAKAPHNPRAEVSLGMVLASAEPRRYSEAEGAMRSAIAKDSTYFVAWRTLGFLAAEQGHWSEALQAYEGALRLKPANIDVNVLAARALIALGRATDAVPYVDRAGPVDGPLLWSVGARLVELGNGRAAIKYLEEAANMSNEPPPSVGVGLISLAYAQSGRTDDAVMAARAATVSAADTVDAYVLAGRAMSTLRRTGEARAYLRQALAIDPSSASARRAMLHVAGP